MGFGFRKSINLGGGFKINVSKKGIGMSAGTKGARVSVGPKGVRSTVSIPGTGISYSKQSSLKGRKSSRNNSYQSAGCLGCLLYLLVPLSIALLVVTVILPI